MTKSFTLDTPKRSEGWAKFQEWNRKWNQILAKIFGGLCFVLLFAIVIVNVIDSKEIQQLKSSQGDDKNDEAKNNLLFNSKSSRICTLSTCDVACSNGIIENINMDIETVLSSKKCSSIKLEISDYQANFILSNNWYTLDYPITEFAIRDCNFEIIEENAFSSKAFSATISFIMMSVKVKSLGYNIFSGLVNVETLTLERLTNIEWIAPNLLEPMSSSLSSLSIHHMKPTFGFKNITGTSKLSAQIVDLSFNNFGDTINDNTFNGLQSVISLYLISGSISSLTSGAFQHMRNSIQAIYLNTNHLTTLPSGIFYYLIDRKNTKIFLNDNIWACECTPDILEFKENLNLYSSAFPKDVICNSPISLRNKELRDAEIICPDDDITTSLTFPSSKSTAKVTSTVTTNSKPASPTVETPIPEYSSSTTLTTPTKSSHPSTPETQSTPTMDITTTNKIIDQNLLTLECENGINLPEVEYEFPITVKAKTTEFLIIEDVNDDIFIEFKIVCYGMALIWFHNSSCFDESSSITNITENSEYGCVKNFKKKIKIEHLRYNINYVFCLKENEEDKVIPFNCLAFLRFDKSSAQITKEPETWIENDQKIYVIAIYVGSLLLSILIGAFIAFCCLKKFPFFVMNKQRRRDSISSESDDNGIGEYHLPPCYVTPVPARAARHGRPSTLRRYSDTSAGSARSYISAVTPSPFEIISWRMNNRTTNNNQINILQTAKSHYSDENNENILYIEKFPDSPPPLPPHPNRHSNDSDQSQTSSRISRDPLFSISYRVQRDTSIQHRISSFAGSHNTTNNSNNNRFP